MQATTVTSREGMVIGPGQAVRAGAELLREGGNAVDAAVATALCAGVVQPSACGLAGFGGALITYQADSGEVSCLEFGTVAPERAHDPFYPLIADTGTSPGVRAVSAEDRLGYRALAVPGTPAGLARALDALGSFPFAAVAAPAIRLAREGFPATPAYVTVLQDYADTLARFPESARWLLPGHAVPRPGTLITNPEHALFLERLANQGLDSFYRGSIAGEIAAHVKAGGAALTAADLAAYRPRELQPLCLRFGDYDIFTAPLPSGGPTVLQALKLLEGMDLGALWREAHRYYHTITLVLETVCADRLARLGDPEAVKLPSDGLFSDSEAAEVRRRITKAVHDAAVLHGPEVIGLPGGTVHITTADRYGNLAALTLSHGEPFGSFVTLPGSGTLLGGGMNCFDPRPGHPNAVGPRKRPLYDMCPTLVLKDRRPVLVLGAAGGRRMESAMLQTLLYFCALHKGVEEAVALPRVHPEGGGALLAESHLPQTATDYLRAIGCAVETGPVGTLHALACLPDQDLLLGVADPRASALALAA